MSASCQIKETIKNGTCRISNCFEKVHREESRKRKTTKCFSSWSFSLFLFLSIFWSWQHAYATFIIEETNLKTLNVVEHFPILKAQEPCCLHHCLPSVSDNRPNLAESIADACHSCNCYTLMSMGCGLLNPAECFHVQRSESSRPPLSRFYYYPSSKDTETRAQRGWSPGQGHTAQNTKLRVPPRCVSLYSPSAEHLPDQPRPPREGAGWGILPGTANLHQICKNQSTVENNILGALTCLLSPQQCSSACPLISSFLVFFFFPFN